jgi:hypothetical protein
MKYQVHIYATVRVKTEPIEANSQLEAMQKADELNLHEIFDRAITRKFDPEIEHIEYAEEITGYMVDNVGDEEFAGSRFYDANKEPESPL